MTPTECCVCSSPMLTITLSMVECGASAEEIAETTTLPLAAVEQHLKQCCTAPPEFPLGIHQTESDARLRTWILRSNQSWYSCTLIGDARGAQAALASGIKAELSLRAEIERQEARQDQTAIADPAAPFGRNANGDAYLITRELSDVLLKQHDEQVALFNLTPCPCCNSTANEEMYTSNPGFLRGGQAAQVEKMLKGVTINDNCGTAGDSAGVTAN